MKFELIWFTSFRDVANNLVENEVKSGCSETTPKWEVFWPFLSEASKDYYTRSRSMGVGFCILNPKAL